MKFFINGSSNRDKKRLYDYLSTLQSTLYEVSVVKKKRKRSISQNNYYWGVLIPLISDVTGMWSDEVHFFLKEKFGQKKEVVNRVTGEVHVHPITTKDYTTIAFEEYLETCRQWALLEINCHIPLPNDPIVEEMYLSGRIDL